MPLALHRQMHEDRADQRSKRHETPASEADLDNTVRTLTEQRLSDSLATGVSSMNQ